MQKYIHKFLLHFWWQALAKRPAIDQFDSHPIFESFPIMSIPQIPSVSDVSMYFSHNSDLHCSIRIIQSPKWSALIQSYIIFFDQHYLGIYESSFILAIYWSNLRKTQSTNVPIVTRFPCGLLATTLALGSHIWKQSIPFFGDSQTTRECWLSNRFVPQSAF